MNTFAERPLLFFMDNMSPIISVKAPKGDRKIVELSDTGCDAGSPVPNVDRYFSQKMYKVRSNEDWSLVDERIEKSRDLKLRIQKNRSAVEEDCRFEHEKDATNQYWWHRNPQNDDISASKVLERDPDSSRDARSKIKTTSQRSRTRNWRHDNDPRLLPNGVYYNCTTTPQNIPKNPNHSAKDRPSAPKIASASSKFVRSNHLIAKDPRIEDQETLASREKEIHLELDYPEDFETNEILRNSSRKCKDHNRRSSNLSQDNAAKNPLENASQKSTRSFKYTARNPRISSAPKPNDASNESSPAIDSKIRSRTRSPPADRRKRVRPYAKQSGNDPDRSQNRYVTDQDHKLDCSCNDLDYSRTPRSNSIHSERKFKQFTDRAVDKDSLSEVSNASTSTDHARYTSMIDDGPRNSEETRTTKNNFWEFVPLVPGEEDPDYDKRLPAGKNIAHACQQQGFNDPSVSRSPKDYTVDGRTKRTSDQKTECLEAPLNFLLEDDLENKTTNAAKDEGLRLPVGSSYRDQSCESLVNISEAELNSVLITAHLAATDALRHSKDVEMLKSHGQHRCESSSQSRICGKLPFGYLNRSKDGAKSEARSEKIDRNGNRSTENRDASNLDNEGTICDIVERTAARLKRKLDRSKAEEASSTPNRSLTPATGKEIRSQESTCSRLPIRIGNRRRSRNPVSAQNRSDAKSYERQEDNEKMGSKEQVDLQDLGSARSRTKPKLKPSVVQNRDIAEVVDDSAGNLKSKGDLKCSGEVCDRLDAGSTERSRLAKNQTDVGSVDNVDLKTSSSTVTFFKNEKLRASSGGKRIVGLDNFETGKDSSRRTKGIGNNDYCGRKMFQKNDSNWKKPPVVDVSRSGFKEKCCFHVNNAEDIVCNNYQEKGQRSLSSFRAKKPIAVASRY